MNLTLQSQQENKQLINEVRTDALTGVSNRRAFDQYVKEQFERTIPDRPTSVLFTDLDHFKSFNDTHGHALGDRVLVVFAETLRRTVGDQGTVFRYGGEEFAVVCPNTDRTTAARLAEQSRHAVEEDARGHLGRRSRADPHVQYWCRDIYLRHVRVGRTVGQGG